MRFFILGLLSTLSIRLIIIAKHLDIELVKIAWYAGVIGYKNILKQATLNGNKAPVMNDGLANLLFGAVTQYEYSYCKKSNSADFEITKSRY